MSSPIKVLIIDDEPGVLASLSEYFKRKGYEVFPFSNGLDALKMIEALDGKLDLIITDLVMPNISGVALISIVKKKYPRLPIIAITGWGKHPEALAKEAKGDLIIEKPFSFSKLEKSAKNLLEQYSSLLKQGPEI
jgi:DNA-binding NtrC family response regulator